MKDRLERLWRELAGENAPRGVLKRLLEAEWDGQLSAAVVKPGDKPALLLEMSTAVAIDTAQLSGGKFVDLSTSGDETGIRVIQITLEDSKFQDTFSVLAADLAQRILASSTEHDGARAFVYNLERWLNFLKRRPLKILGRKQVQGLYGELSILLDLVAPVIGFERAVQAWTGPQNTQQDFQFPSIAIEVKTLSATQPQQLKIQSERQLEDRGLSALLLAHVAVDEKKDSGRSLPGVVERIRMGLRDEGVSEEAFEDLLFESGYLEIHSHLYMQSGFVERKVRFYRVSTGFPRLTEEDLMHGIGGVQYRLDASACAPFGVEREQVESWLADAPPIEDPLDQEESEVLEFKASAWKSLKEGIPDKVINEGVVKSVAAMMNARGGLVIIGLEDGSGRVLGIGLDLDHLNTDQDGYLNRLSTLLIRSLGHSHASRLRIEFRGGGDEAICLIRVGASSRPVWAVSPASKSRVFWVRVNNTTREVRGEEMVNYIRDHWG